MQIQWTPELIFHAGETVALLLVGWVGQKINSAVSAAKDDLKEAVAGVKAEQSRAKEELKDGQNEMRRDIDDKHGKNERAIAVHSAADEQQFKSIGESLGRIERKVDLRNGTP